MNKKFLSNKVVKFKIMSNKKIIKNINKKLIFAILLFFIIFAIVLNPSKYISVALKGILVWGTQILPALFPFMIFTKLLTLTGYIAELSSSFSNFTKRFYNSPGISSYIFFMSIVSGYPLGAKITSDLYNNNYISRSEASRIVSFTSNSGPMFIIGTVGVGMLLSSICGYIILISHILGAMLNGIIYRKYSPKEIQLKKSNIKKIDNQENILSNIMLNGINSCLLVGGYITIFFVICEVLNSIGIFNPLVLILEKLGVEKSLSCGLIFGLFEMTNGCLLIANSSANLIIKTSLCALLISFGGLAISFQAFAFLDDFKISKKYYYVQKTTHAILTFIICIFISCIFI